MPRSTAPKSRQPLRLRGDLPHITDPYGQEIIHPACAGDLKFSIVVMRIHTIGFTRTSASDFFSRLRDSGARSVIDVRLRNTSHLAGFAKRDDLAWLLRELCGMDYIHMPRLAPTGAMLDAYRQGQDPWTLYESQFERLMERRLVHVAVPRELVTDSCLLCSEPEADQCHRRLVAEHWQRHWKDLEVVHL